MQKTIISVVVLVAVVVGAYFIITKNKPEVSNEAIVNTDAMTQETQTGETSSKKMAFSEFVKQDDRPYKCEVKQAMSDFENSGTVYLDKGNVRGEFTTIAEGRTLDTMFIARDGYTYIWSSALPNTGFKTKLAAKTDTTGTDVSGTYSWNADQIGDYDCMLWTPDQSKFIVPTNISFKVIGE